jgi:predicted transposase/invertase (TIGR01784 family)
MATKTTKLKNTDKNTSMSEDDKKLRFVDPRNDIAFKKIFGNDLHHEALIDFLNSVLKLPEPILEVSIANSPKLPTLKTLKSVALDVHARDSKREFIIEMQVENRKNFAKRIFSYIAKTYMNQLDAGEDYTKLKPVIFLAVMDFVYFKNDDERPVKRHVHLDDERFYQEFYEFDMNFIELPRFNKTEEELETNKDRWVYFLKHTASLHDVPNWALKYEGLKWAYEMAERHNWTKDELDVYDYWQRKECDYKNSIDDVRQEAEAIGERRGHAQGKAESAKAIALELLKLGLDTKKISEATKLTPEEIEKIKRS